MGWFEFQILREQLHEIRREQNAQRALLQEIRADCRKILKEFEPKPAARIVLTLGEPTAQ